MSGKPRRSIFRGRARAEPAWGHPRRGQRWHAPIIVGSLLVVAVALSAVAVEALERPPATVTTCDGLVASWNELDQTALAPTVARMRTGQTVDSRFVVAEINAYVAGLRRQLGAITDLEVRSAWRQTVVSGIAAATELGSRSFGRDPAAIVEFTRSGTAAAQACGAYLTAADDD